MLLMSFSYKILYCHCIQDTMKISFAANHYKSQDTIFKCKMCIENTANRSNPNQINSKISYTIAIIALSYLILNPWQITCGFDGLSTVKPQKEKYFLSIGPSKKESYHTRGEVSKQRIPWKFPLDLRGLFIKTSQMVISQIWKMESQ